MRLEQLRYVINAANCSVFLVSPLQRPQHCARYSRNIYLTQVPLSYAGCSRRASGSSLRSQTSQRSVASTRSSSVSKSGGGGDGATSSGSNARNHDPVRSTSSSPLDGNGAAASGRQEQPITRTLRLHLSQDMRDKASCSHIHGALLRSLRELLTSEKSKLTGVQKISCRRISNTSLNT